MMMTNFSVASMLISLFDRVATIIGKGKKCWLPAFSPYPSMFWLVVLGFNITLIAKVISWRSVKHVFPGFLSPVLTQLFYPTTFLTCFCRGERQKYAGKKSRLNRELNSQPPGHESDRK